MGIRLRSTVILAVYQKSLRQSNAARAETTTGKVVNLMSSDATRMQWSGGYLHWLPCAFLQVFIGMYMLWQLIGPALFAGLAVIALNVPITYMNTMLMGRFSNRLMAARDRRVAAVNETLSAIKLVKSNSWQESFKQRITLALPQVSRVGVSM